MPKESGGKEQKKGAKEQFKQWGISMGLGLLGPIGKAVQGYREHRAAQEAETRALASEFFKAREEVWTRRLDGKYPKKEITPLIERFKVIGDQLIESKKGELKKSEGLGKLGLGGFASAFGLGSEEDNEERQDKIKDRLKDYQDELFTKYDEEVEKIYEKAVKAAKTGPLSDELKSENEKKKKDKETAKKAEKATKERDKKWNKSHPIEDEDEDDEDEDEDDEEAPAKTVEKPSGEPAASAANASETPAPASVEAASSASGDSGAKASDSTSSGKKTSLSKGPKNIYQKRKSVGGGYDVRKMAKDLASLSSTVAGLQQQVTELKSSTATSQIASGQSSDKAQ